MTMQSQNSEETHSDDIAEPRAMPATSDTETRTDSEADRPEPRNEHAHDIQERRPLFDENELSGYRSRLTEVQARFVDDPRGTVKEADALVNDVMQRLTQTFTAERRQGCVDGGSARRDAALPVVLRPTALGVATRHR